MKDQMDSEILGVSQAQETNVGSNNNGQIGGW